MMATTQASSSLLAAGRIPESVQPGGGGCMSIELAWGRWRRWSLRAFWPAYVKSMQAKRQGECPNCPHDIVDPRDLKFSRNVCGFWFRPEDDPFAWRGRLPLARAGLAEVICFSLLFATLTGISIAGGLVLHSAFFALLIVALPLWAFVLSFFRDPQRVLPTEAAALVSPADGKVTHIGEVDEPGFPGGRAWRISIFLSVFNVHVNRSPRSVLVKQVRYFPGEFLDARHSECAVRNEQLWLDLVDEATGQPVRVKQISGAIARRIVCWLKAGDRLERGERFGMIKFGSRTEVLLPAGQGYDVKVQVGDTVKGGATILLLM
jgi:phosphatidylserine decarboxylase